MMVTIRNATVNDLSDIVAFQLAMALETEDLALDPDTVSNGVRAVFDDPGKGVYYVAEAETKIVGSLLTTFEWSDWRNGNILWIQSVYILPDYRGKGIFRMFYGHIKSLVLHPENHLSGIRLYVEKNNLPARQVYAKLGMTNHHYETYEWMKP